MSGRALSWLLMALLAAALVGQTLHARRRVDADRVLHQVEVVSVHLAGSGERAAPVFWANVKLLQRAQREAPADSRLLLAEGSQYLLLGRAEEAAATYQRALAVEARPEIYLNLGRAQLALGDRQAAAASFHAALTLAPMMRSEVPRELRPSPHASEPGGETLGSTNSAE